jgi:hypothetical protein
VRRDQAHEFDLEEVLVRTNHSLGLHPVCDLLSGVGLLMGPVPGQQSTELLALHIANDRLNLISATDSVYTRVTHLLDDGTEYSVEGKHDVSLRAEHNPKELLESIGINLAVEQLLGRHEQMVVVLLCWVFAMLDTEMLNIRISKTKLDSDWVDWLITNSGQFLCQVFACQETGVEDLRVSKLTKIGCQ